MPETNGLSENFPKVTHADLIETINKVFATGANEIDPKEIFGDDLEGVTTLPRRSVTTMFPHEESIT
jgi:hypothetical protein